MPGFSSPYGAILRRVSGVPVTATTIRRSTLTSTSDNATIANGPVSRRVPTAARSAPAPSSAPSPIRSGCRTPVRSAATVMVDRASYAPVIAENAASYSASTSSLRSANVCVAAMVAASGKISGSFARSGSIFSSSACTPSTGET